MKFEDWVAAGFVNEIGQRRVRFHIEVGPEYHLTHSCGQVLHNHLSEYWGGFLGSHLDSDNSLLMPTATDSCLPSRPEVADPVDLTVRGEEVAAAFMFEGRHRVCVALASFSPGDSEERHRAHWDS